MIQLSRNLPAMPDGDTLPAPAPLWPAEPAGDRSLLEHGLLACAFGALPLARLWQLAPEIGSDLALTTAAIFAGVAWHLWHCLQEAPASRPRGAPLAVIVLLLALGGWQLAWVGVEDFWFCRLGLVAWIVGWVGLLWGWAGLVWGWRPIAALGLWALALNGRLSPESASLEAWVAERTADVSGWLLWQGGNVVAVQEAKLLMADARVEIGAPCTGLPLAFLLLPLLAIATLLLRLRWAAAALVAIAVVCASFVIGVIRVSILALMAGNPARFEYWHGDNGGAWFTAAGILALMWFLLQVHPGHPATPRTAVHVPRGTWLFALAPLALGAGLAGSVAAARSAPARPAPGDFNAMVPGFHIVADHASLGAGSAPAVNRIEWMRKVIYESAQTGAQFEVQLAYLPVAVAGDPAALAGAPNFNPSPAPDGGEVLAGVQAGRPAWFAFIPPGEVSLASDQARLARDRRAWHQPARWWNWWAHRQPMRDKRAYWLALRWNGDSAEGQREPARMFARWSAQVRGLSTERQP